MRKPVFIAVLSLSILVSMLFWLIRSGSTPDLKETIMMIFEEHIDLERSTFIGAGIKGMALIFALSWVYHNYIRRSHD